jgi:hypothetical protein
MDQFVERPDAAMLCTAEKIHRCAGRRGSCSGQRGSVAACRARSSRGKETETKIGTETGIGTETATGLGTETEIETATETETETGTDEAGFDAKANSSDLLTASPPAEQTANGQDYARQACAERIFNRRNVDAAKITLP